LIHYKKKTINEEPPMKRLGILVIVTMVIVSVGLTTGCGRKQTTTVQSTNTTLGQELVDLQQAYEKGIITEKEYNDMKKKAMKKYK
jgi:uncharacterized membrane protein